MKLGCPAMIKVGKKVIINPTQCVGCKLCMAVCPQQAISKVGEK